MGCCNAAWKVHWKVTPQGRLQFPLSKNSKGVLQNSRVAENHKYFGKNRTATSLFNLKIHKNEKSVFGLDGRCFEYVPFLLFHYGYSWDSEWIWYGRYRRWWPRSDPATTSTATTTRRRGPVRIISLIWAMPGNRAWLFYCKQTCNHWNHFYSLSYCPFLCPVVHRTKRKRWLPRRNMTVYIDIMIVLLTKKFHWKKRREV